MSHLLEQLEGRERRAECLRNEAALNGDSQPATPTPKPYSEWDEEDGRRRVEQAWREWDELLAELAEREAKPKARAFFAECEAEARKVMRGAA